MGKKIKEGFKQTSCKTAQPEERALSANRIKAAIILHHTPRKEIQGQEVELKPEEWDKKDRQRMKICEAFSPILIPKTSITESKLAEMIAQNGIHEFPLEYAKAIFKEGSNLLSDNIADGFAELFDTKVKARRAIIEDAHTDAFLHRHIN